MTQGALTGERRLRVLIVGCGNIAGKFDEGQPQDSPPYTHAGAYRRDGRFDITACAEPDESRRAAFMRAWRVPAGFGSIDEALEAGDPSDVISICSPTACHEHDMERALRAGPRLIFCEKPITPSYAASERLVSACRESRILIAVNHTRRWDPDVARIQAGLRGGQWGPLRSVAGLYNKGILNNGSHMLDLLQLLLGPLEIVKAGRPIYDFFRDDPSVPAWLEDGQGTPVHLSCGHAGDYAVFELQLVFSRAVLAMEDGGMFWRERQAIDDPTFTGYRTLDAGTHRASGHPLAMRRAVQNVYDAISRNAPLASTGESALSAQRLCEQIRQHACAA